MGLSADKQWLDEVWQKITEKMDWLCDLNGDMIAYTTKDGVKTDSLTKDGSEYGWTNGFWPGMLWLLYYGTKNEKYRQKAEGLELKMDKALYGMEGLHHDVGFMWGLISVTGYRLTKNPESRRRGLIAANYLMSRFQSRGNYLVAWNHKVHESWSIIDTMMNLPLLHWAAEETGMSRYRDVALIHADKTMENMVRSDGSVCHIAVYDTKTGEKLGEESGQGYAVGSAWSRGASWAIYGFAIEYAYTNEIRYLDTAKRAAHYFICSIMDDFIPRIDFRQPAEPNYKDTSTGAIAACGLIEISKHVPEHEKGMYLNAALKILKALYETCCDFTKETEAILLHGSMAYHWGTEMDKDTHLIYGDFFFIEAILKLRGMDISFW